MVEMRPPESVRRAAAALARSARTWERPPFGLSSAERHVVRFDDGSSVFVKMATDGRTAGWLRNERRALRLVAGRIAPDVLCWQDYGDRPLLVTTDLSGAYWPAAVGETVVWRPGDIEALLAALDGLRRLEPGEGWDLVADWPPALWGGLIDSPALVRAGLCSAEWLARCGPPIAAADERAEPGRDCLVHGDVRSDNLCLLEGGEVRLVDWSMCGVGHPEQDLARLLPSLRLEGGPPPGTVLRKPVALIARLCGSTVSRAVGDEAMPDWLRRVFLRLAVIDLNWLADLFDLEPPDGPMARA